MEELRDTLINIIAEQNKELTQFRTDNYWYDNWRLVTEENKQLRQEICRAYHEMDKLNKGGGGNEQSSTETA